MKKEGGREGIWRVDAQSRHVEAVGARGRAGRLVGRLGRRKRTQGNGAAFLAKLDESADLQRQVLSVDLVKYALR